MMFDQIKQDTDDNYRSECAKAISEAFRDDSGKEPDPRVAIKIRRVIEEEMKAGTSNLPDLIRAGKAVFDNEGLGSKEPLPS